MTISYTNYNLQVVITYNKVVTTYNVIINR